MGKQSLSQKTEIVEQVGTLLDGSQMVLVIDYKGVTISEMNILRSDLRESDSICMVVKNTLMRRAITDRPDWAGLDRYLAGPSAFILIRGDIGKAVKAYEGFQKQVKKTEFRGAAIDGLALDLEQAKAIADLPPKEVLMAQVAGGLNSMATRLATSVNGVPTKLVTGINEIPASLGRVLRALSEREAA